MLHNHNVKNPVNRNYIEVENINEKNTWTIKKCIDKYKNICKMNHEVYANPNETDQILINILSKAKKIHIPKTTR